MKNFRRYAGMLAAAASTVLMAALAACSAIDEPDPGFNTPSLEVDSDEMAINFSVDNMQMGSMNGTRAEGDADGSDDGSGDGSGDGTESGGESTPETDADGHPAYPAETHEKQLNHAYFIFFKDGKFLTYQRTDVQPGATKITFPVPSVLQPTVNDASPIEYDVIILGNMDYYPPTGYATFQSFLNACTKGKTQRQVETALAIGLDHTMNKNTDQYLPMVGTLRDGQGNDMKFWFKVVEGRYVSDGSILFRRQVARIDLNNYATQDLEIKWVKVCNYRNNTYLWLDDYTKGTVQPGISDESPEEQAPYYLAVDPAEQSVSGVYSQKIRASLYTLPNSISKPTQDDAVTTYLMIAAHYKGSEDLNYYRFNLNQGKEAQLLEKNHVYTANIMGVKGPGAPTESAARLTNAPVLVATVEETWEDSDTNSDADASGNFIILSKTSVTFDGDQGLKQKITVKVREGMTWKLEEVNSTGNANGDFSHTIEKDETEASGSITFQTLTRNNTNFVKYGYFKVTGLTKDGKTLSVAINVQQLSVNDDVKMLTVNGQTGTLTPRISGTGTTFLYQVQTGSTTQGWTVKPVGNDGKDAENEFSSNWGSQGASYTKAGGNKGFLEIVIPANISGADREITLKVTRNGVTEEEVAPVYIKLKQPKSKVLLSIYPYPQNGVMELEGFLNETKQVNRNTNEERTNTFSVQKDIFVNLADPVNYLYKVETDFDGCRDLSLSPNSAILRTQKSTHIPATAADNANYTSKSPTVTMATTNGITQTYLRNPHYQILDKMQNGQKFYLNVFRTGPGDPDIVGTIRVTAYHKDGTEKGESQTISFDVRITTNCEISDVVLANGSTPILVADRNVGAVPRLNGTTYNRALNYSGYPDLHATNTTSTSDFDNKLFSGGYFTWTDMTLENGNNLNNQFATWAKDNYFRFNQDPGELTSPFYTTKYQDKWRVPTTDEFHIIWKNLQWSKQRPYIVSVLKHNGKYMGCYFPCAATTDNTKRENCGYYWTCSQRDANQAYYKSLDATGYYQAGDNSKDYNYTYFVNKSNKYTVRCIIPLSTTEQSTYQTWINKH